MPRSEVQIADYEKTLDRVVRTISRKPMTAQAIADREGVVKATAHAWMKLLLKRKVIRVCGKVRGLSGNWAAQYGAPLNSNGSPLRAHNRLAASSNHFHRKDRTP